MLGIRPRCCGNQQSTDIGVWLGSGPDVVGSTPHGLLCVVFAATTPAAVLCTMQPGAATHTSYASCWCQAASVTDSCCWPAQTTTTGTRMPLPNTWQAISFDSPQQLCATAAFNRLVGQRLGSDCLQMLCTGHASLCCVRVFCGVLCRWLVVSKGATALHVAALQQHALVVLAIMQHYALLLRDWLPVDSSSHRPIDPRSW